MWSYCWKQIHANISIQVNPRAPQHTTTQSPSLCEATISPHCLHQLSHTGCVFIWYLPQLWHTTTNALIYCKSGSDRLRVMSSLEQNLTDSTTKWWVRLVPHLWKWTLESDNTLRLCFQNWATGLILQRRLQEWVPWHTRHLPRSRGWPR